jgi:hypothetical protein
MFHYQYLFDLTTRMGFRYCEEKNLGHYYLKPKIMAINWRMSQAVDDFHPYAL